MHTTMMPGSRAEVTAINIVGPRTCRGPKGALVEGPSFVSPAPTPSCHTQNHQWWREETIASTSFLVCSRPRRCSGLCK